MLRVPRSLKVFVYNIWRDIPRHEARKYAESRSINLWPSTDVFETDLAELVGLDDLALHGVVWRHLEKKLGCRIIDFNMHVFRYD